MPVDPDLALEPFDSMAEEADAAMFDHGEQEDHEPASDRPVDTQQPTEPAGGHADRLWHTSSEVRIGTDIHGNDA